MYHECRHILPSGKRCHSPALHGQAYCYYHNNLRRCSRPLVGDNFTLPSIEDNRGIQIALTQVLTALNSPYMDTRRAGLMLYGLQIATQLANRTSDLEPDEAVRTCDDSTGAALAPEKTVCEPPRDCRNCPRQHTCENYEEPAEDDKKKRWKKQRSRTMMNTQQAMTTTPKTRGPKKTQTNATSNHPTQKTMKGTRMKMRKRQTKKKRP